MTRDILTKKIVNPYSTLCWSERFWFENCTLTLYPTMFGFLEHCFFASREGLYLLGNGMSGEIVLLIFLTTLISELITMCIMQNETPIFTLNLEVKKANSEY